MHLYALKTKQICVKNLKHVQMYAPKCLNKHEKKYALKNDQNYHLF